jgi:hypothetical protein
LKLSGEGFLEAFSLAVRRQNIPGVSISRVELFEGSIISSKRLYLRVRLGALSYYVFGASLGEAFFISSWLIWRRSLSARVLLCIPLIGPIFSRLVRMLEADTFYAHDSALHFMELVHFSLMGVVDTLTNTENIQPLPEEQRKPVLRELYSRPQAPQLTL